MPKVIINAADTGALESTARMFKEAGWDVSRPDEDLIFHLRKNADLEGVYSPQELKENWGYDLPQLDQLATVHDVDDADLFVDVKAHTNYAKIVNRWPHLEGKVLWLCLNGGDPFARTDGQPWANPPCPVLTHNQWYRAVHNSYVCYPPYARWGVRRRTGVHGHPICLVHNVARWGYGNILPDLKRLGVRFYGGGEGNDALLAWPAAMELLEKAPCMVHVKKGDTVGYAMVEALSMGVPFVCTQFYIDECRHNGLLLNRVTCLTFNPSEAADSLAEVLQELSCPVFNAKIGNAGRAMYKSVAWHADRDLPTWKAFLRAQFPKAY